VLRRSIFSLIEWQLGAESDGGCAVSVGGLNDRNKAGPIGAYAPPAARAVYQGRLFVSAGVREGDVRRL
jgi:hypothetical protein